MAIKEEFIHSFVGFDQSPSRCHIRVLEESGKPLVVLCSQMAKKPGTSVTNAVDAITQDIKCYLSRDNITLTAAIQRYVASSRLTKILEDLVSKLKDSKSTPLLALESLKLALEYREKFLERTGEIDGLIWVEHYAAGLGLTDNESYALVSFVPDSWTPQWKYLPIEEIAAFTTYPVSDFKVTLEVLQS